MSEPISIAWKFSLLIIIIKIGFTVFNCFFLIRILIGTLEKNFVFQKIVFKIVVREKRNKILSKITIESF